MAQVTIGQWHDRSALILYGSETGNSQEVAEELGRLCERLHFETRVSEMDCVDMNLLLEYTIVIFAISTTGQGELPKNSRNFWKSLLRKRLLPNCLGPVSFTTFGLGDSSYPQFNWAARKLHKRLAQLGAKEIYPRGEADEQHNEGIDGAFLPWSLDLRKHLLSLYPLADGQLPIPSDVLLPPKFTLALLEPRQHSPLNATDSAVDPNILATTEPDNIVKSKISSASNPNHKAPHVAMESFMKEAPYKEEIPSSEPQPGPQLKEKVKGVTDPIDTDLPETRLLDLPDSIYPRLVENKRLTPESHWQDVRELTFILNAKSGSEGYRPGDVMTIYPMNFPEDVQSLIDLMGWQDVADFRVTFKLKSPAYFGAKNLLALPQDLHPVSCTTLRGLLTHNLDITSIPKRHFFQLIAHYCNDPTHKERLLEFNNPFYSDEFFDYTSRPRRSILEVLQDFPSVKLPWQVVTTLFPIIRGRQYSISSNGNLKMTDKKGYFKVQLLVAIVKYRTVLKRIRQGLCSRYLASLPVDTVVNATIQCGSFGSVAKYHPTQPVILIGPGTGLAPLRSLIWLRASVALPAQVQRATTLLFYGGRNESADYFYRDDWEATGTHVFTAFSRDQEEKIYVQDVIRREKKLVVDLIKQNATIYVCGSSGNMPKAVRKALTDIIREALPFENQKLAEEMLQDTEKDGRYIQETW